MVASNDVLAEGSILSGPKRAVVLIVRTSALLSWLRTALGRRGVMRGYRGRWPRWYGAEGCWF